MMMMTRDNDDDDSDGDVMTMMMTMTLVLMKVTVMMRLPFLKENPSQVWFFILVEPEFLQEACEPQTPQQTTAGLGGTDVPLPWTFRGRNSVTCDHQLGASFGWTMLFLNELRGLDESPPNRHKDLI